MRNKMKFSEDSEQEALFAWADVMSAQMPELKYMYHVPNGGQRDIRTAVALKRRGVKAGVPDIVLPAARGEYHGLYVELKVGSNKPSEKQQEYLQYLNEQGYKAVVCYGWREAMEEVCKYLNKDDRNERNC